VGYENYSDTRLLEIDLIEVLPHAFILAIMDKLWNCECLLDRPDVQNC